MKNYNQEKELNWKDIPLSKEINPREVIDKRPYGKQYGERWYLHNDGLHARSMFAGRGNKSNK